MNFRRTSVNQQKLMVHLRHKKKKKKTHSPIESNHELCPRASLVVDAEERVEVARPSVEKGKNRSELLSQSSSFSNTRTCLN